MLLAAGVDVVERRRDGRDVGPGAHQSVGPTSGRLVVISSVMRDAHRGMWIAGLHFLTLVVFALCFPMALSNVNSPLSFVAR